MARAFAEMHRVLDGHGICCVMFDVNIVAKAEGAIRENTVEWRHDRPREHLTANTEWSPPCARTTDERCC